MSKVNVNDPTQIVISISQNFPQLKRDLIGLAGEESRSLSNYLTLVLSDHVNSKKGGKRK